MREAPSAGGMGAGRVLVVGLAAAAAMVALALGCGGSGIAKARLPDGVRARPVEHEACEDSGRKVEIVDVNNDGKPDIRRVFDGARELCRISDLDRDGKPDMFEYYGSDGLLRRREADFDSNGIVNVIDIYEAGKLVRAEVDASNHGRIDTWDAFDPQTGQRTRRERDANGDGRVDQWWVYSGDQATVTTDRDGDGKPDPGSEVTFQGSTGGAAPPPTTAAAPSLDAGAPESPPPAVAGDAGAADAGAPPSPRRGGAKR